MAGEKKGKTYEALVKVALDALRSSGKVKGDVFWNQKPKGMTIEPDFTIGKDKDTPSMVILVTHSGAGGNSHMKFWRNVGELVEAKTVLPKEPKVLNLAFDSVIKADLKRLQGAAFDGQLMVEEKSYGPSLLAWVAANANALPMKAADRVDAIKAIMAGPSGGTNPKKLVQALTKDILVLLGSTNPALKGLWATERKRPRGKAATAHDTFLRRGVGKLLLLDKPDQISANGKLDLKAPIDLVEALQTTGLAAKTIAGVTVTDAEMLWARSQLPLADLQQLCSARNQPRMKEWIDALRTLGAIDAQLDYMAKYWNELILGEKLFKHLKKCHTNPSAVAPTIISSGSKSVWLFHLIVEWVKIAGGSRTNFGLAKVVEDVDRLASDNTHKDTVKRILGRAAIWHAKRSVELGLTDWHSAPSKQAFSFTEDDLARVADALARRLSLVSPPSPITDALKVTEALVQTNLEAKLLTYRGFRPFEVLLNAELNKAGLTGTMQTAMRACFADAAIDAGAKLDPRSSGTSVLQVKNTLINWQSAHDSHTNDKRKELCGRAVALRYAWDSTKKEFVTRVGVKRLILIVDGTWRQSDLAALVSAGWDTVLYPDNLNSLASEIV